MRTEREPQKEISPLEKLESQEIVTSQELLEAFHNHVETGASISAEKAIELIERTELSLVDLEDLAESAYQKGIDFYEDLFAKDRWKAKDYRKIVEYLERRIAEKAKKEQQ